MPCSIDDVVNTAHNPEITLVIIETCIPCKIITGVFSQISGREVTLIVPERGKAAGRKREPYHDISDLGKFLTMNISTVASYPVLVYGIDPALSAADPDLPY